ncbi:MAG: hypothetical protein V1791_01170, partial [Pseudomonadota bacterium]
MTPETKTFDHKKAPFRHLFSAAAIVWSVVAVAILVLELKDQRYFLTANALNTARTSFERDVGFRRWLASHGGACVPSFDSTPSKYDSADSHGHITSLNPV